MLTTIAIISSHFAIKHILVFIMNVMQSIYLLRIQLLCVDARVYSRYMILSVRERNMFDIVNLVWTFRSVQQRMILRDTQLIRSSAGYRWNFITGGKIPKLKCLSRDAVMLTLTTNNTQERQVAPLVNRLEGHITPQVREQLLCSYTGIVCFSF